jgi:hypothetical protein
MKVDATLEALLADASSSFRELLKRAYELGYREALAHGRVSPVNGGLSDEPQQAASLLADTVDDDLEPLPDEASTPEHIAERDELEPSSPVAAAGPEGGAAEVARAVVFDWGDLDEPSEETRNSRPRDVIRVKIFPHATVGTLRQRVIDYFGLERFDIDVVICRKGDRARRQLKSSVKLSKYEVEG